MKLSFIIPAHDEEKYIDKCLNSLLRVTKNSSYKTEIIVVNNASKDKTQEIASRHQNVKVINEPHKSLTRARQAGFLASDGDLIANLDADTIISPGWIEKVMNEFRKNKKLVALSGPQVYYDLPAHKKFIAQSFYLLIFCVYVINRYIFRIASVVQGGNFVIKRSALEKIGGFNLSLDFYGEDVDLAKRLFKVGQVKFSLGLPIFASGRRLQNDGMVITALRYSLNYFWIIIFHKPFTKKQIRKRLFNLRKKALSYYQRINEIEN